MILFLAAHAVLMIAINVGWWVLLRDQRCFTDYWHGEAMRYLDALGWDRAEEEARRRQRPDRKRVN